MKRNPERRMRVATLLADVRKGTPVKQAILNITRQPSITALAAAAGLSRHQVDECLGGRRELPHVRRALELFAELPPYSLDETLTINVGV